MTLNTFHLAGHGAANVTLGIPRLREIVLTASANPSTPTMKIPFTEHVTEEQQKQFIKDYTRLTISQVVDHVSVSERLTAKTAQTSYSRRRIYEVTMHLFSKKEYQEEYSTTPMQILRGLATTFIPKLQDEIRKELKLNSKQAKAQAADVGKSHAPVNTAVGNAADEEETDIRGRLDEGAEDGDADDQRRALQGAQQHTYDDESDAEENGEDNFEKNFGADLSGSDDDSEDEEAKEAKAKAHEPSLAENSRVEAMKVIETEVNENAKLVHDFVFDKTNGGFCTFRLDVSFIKNH